MSKLKSRFVQAVRRTHDIRGSPCRLVHAGQFASTRIYPISMENPEQNTMEHENAEHRTAEHITAERQTTESDTTQDAKTKGPEEGAKDEYRLYDNIAGLYITMNPANVHGRTTVIRHAGTEDFLVWDSSWDHTQPFAEMTVEVARNAAHSALGVVTDYEKLSQPITVYHAPVKGIPSIMRSEPKSARLEFVQEYAKAHDPARVTKDDFKGPIPAARMGDNVNPIVTGDSASGSTGVVASGLDDSLFLYAHEHNANWVTLILDLQDPSAPKMQLGKNRRVDLLQQDDTDEPFHIKYYAFKHGYTLRLKNCGHTTQIRGGPIEGKIFKGKSTKSSRATIKWKEFHLHLPFDRWHAPCKHDTWEGKYNGRAQGMHNKDYAKHNVVMFPRFMDRLEEIIGEGRIWMYKQSDGELDDIDAEDEVEEEEGEDSGEEDDGGEAALEGGDGGSE
ncbi:uncharacterized protein J4E92_010080 [Alternaria infectoria]|uniref:uncharacterized protein n=1 Tax=Alternaria infectoria TaxID=45303 RepID=UPI00221F587F|nr:uncharacterized protein J4E92_010080 [Alternaria infectoria]KAI4912229.1 hypothetical protein J4E92_010080 [Alternaria infectoria]